MENTGWSPVSFAIMEKSGLIEKDFSRQNDKKMKVPPSEPAVEVKFSTGWAVLGWAGVNFVSIKS